MQLMPRQFRIETLSVIIQLLDRPNGTTRKEYIPEPHQSPIKQIMSRDVPHSSDSLGLEYSKAVNAAGRSISC